MSKSFCELLPKIELHAHLNGSISIETLEHLREYNMKNNQPQMDDKTWCYLKGLFLQSQIPTLSECFEIFKMSHSVTNNPYTVQAATESVIKDFAHDNVIYLELRSTLRSEDGMTKTQYLESMIRGVKNCKKTHPSITVKLIVSLNRRHSIEEAEENIAIAIAYSKLEPDIIVGIDLSGDPTHKKFTDYVKMLDKAKNDGLKLTIHFAEVLNNSEVFDIVSYGPDRLGHGTFVHPGRSDSFENWDLLMKSKIPVEACITSNLKCRTVDVAKNHHFKHFYDAGYPVVLCTDDKSIFHTNLSSEYEIVKTTFGLKECDLWKLSHNSIDYIFADEDVKMCLRIVLDSWRKEFGL